MQDILDYTHDPDLASIKIIACDMDLTLLADDRTQPPGMAARISALEEAGVVFCPASGRPGPTLQLMFPEHAADMAFCPDNGASIIYRGELIDASLIAPALYHEIIDATLAEGSGVPVLCAFDEAYVPTWGRVHEEAIAEYYKKINYVESYDGIDVDSNKFTIYFPGNNSKAAFDATFGPRFTDRLCVACAGVEWMDFMNYGVNKGAGLAHLCAHLGIDLADAAAVGDTYNDIEILEAAGHSFIVANAAEHMRAHARYMVPSNNDRGVAVLIDAILAAKAEAARD